MKIEWANDGNAVEVDVDGEKKMMFSATIDLEDGQAIQKFEGESHKEITDKLLVAQGNATKRIRELKTPPATPAAAPQKKVLSADERFEITHDLTDPNKAPEAVLKMVRLADEEKETKEREQRELYDRVQAAIAQFKEEATDYILCQHNEDLIIKYGELHRYAPDDVTSYHDIWTALKKAGLAVLTQPETTEDPNNPQQRTRRDGGLPATSTTRPRLASSSTSLRRGDSDDAPGAPAKQKYTRDDIDNMPDDEYDEKLANEPGFRKLVDTLK